MNLTLINDIISYCLTNNFAFVIYRKPNYHQHTTKPFFLLQHNSDLKSAATCKNDSKNSRFVFYPFNCDENSPALTLTPFIHKALEDLTSEDFGVIKQLAQPHETAPQFKVQAGLNFADYVVLIKKLKQDFPPLKKIVISNPRPEIHCDIPKLIDIWWQSLLITDAFVYLLNSNLTGTWLGATPELLLSIKQQKITTVALAGTLKKQPDEVYNWSEKEQQEHEVVKDYILQLLAQQGVSELSHSETYTQNASQVVHLKTDISGRLGGDFTPINLAQKLHPTPAIGGFPRDLAIAKILQSESYDRRYYSGFLGLIEPNLSDLFVNLRCLQYYPHQQCVQVYAGGGIMPDSDPKLEWSEMELKAQRLESCFKPKKDDKKDEKCN